MLNIFNNTFPGLNTDKGSSTQSDNARFERQAADFFSNGLKRGVGIQLSPKAENDPSNALFDVQKVVDTVAGFIEQRINQSRVEGASDDEVNNLISQAREGVERGFRLAREDIARADLSEPDLEENIDKAEQGINARIDQIADSSVDDIDSDADSGVLTSLSNVAVSDNKRFQLSAASFEFALVTQEGDRIQVSAQELFQRSERSTSLTSDRFSVGRFDARESSESRFSINIEGDLNDAEREALNNLLVQVADISDSFFSEGVEDAFKQALALNFDSAQIAQFSLDLRASSLSIIEQTDLRSTRGTGIPEAYQAPRLPLGLQTVLSEYADKVEKLLEATQKFSDNLRLIEDGRALAETLQRGFDGSISRAEGFLSRGDNPNALFDALLERL